MRDYPEHPKAIVHRVTTTTVEPRYLLMAWEPIAADRRLVGIHTSLQEANNAVPRPDPQNVTPPHPSAGEDVLAAREAAQARSRARVDRIAGVKRTPVENVPASQAWD